jgi:hypothetical protein
VYGRSGWTGGIQCYRQGVPSAWQSRVERGGVVCCLQLMEGLGLAEGGAWHQVSCRRAGGAGDCGPRLCCCSGLAHTPCCSSSGPSTCSQALHMHYVQPLSVWVGGGGGLGFWGRGPCCRCRYHTWLIVPHIYGVNITLVCGMVVCSGGMGWLRVGQV